TAFLPTADGVDPEGVIVGGASLWITNKVSDEEQDAAWEFVKFMTESDVQAEWAASTGYFPITPDAYEEDILKDVYEEFPQFTTAVDQLEETTPNAATGGALTEVLPEARKIIETALGEMYEGKHPAVAEAGVIGKPDPIRGELVKAFITLRTNFKESKELLEDIRVFVRNQLAAHAAPKEIEVM